MKGLKYKCYSNNMTNEQIKEEFDSIKKHITEDYSLKLKQFPLNINDFHEYVYLVEIYYNKESLYSVTAIDNDDKICFEMVKTENFDELRDVLSILTGSVDDVIFQLSKYYLRN